MAVIDFYCLLCMFSLLPPCIFHMHVLLFILAFVPLLYPLLLSVLHVRLLRVFSRNTEILKISYANTMSRIIHQYHHRRRRVAGEGRGFVAPHSTTARLQRSPSGWVESFRSLFSNKSPTTIIKLL